MAILETVLNKTTTIKELIQETIRWKADGIAAFNSREPNVVVIVINSPDAKAYRQAINKIDDLLSEDRDEDFDH